MMKIDVRRLIRTVTYEMTLTLDYHTHIPEY